MDIDFIMPVTCPNCGSLAISRENMHTWLCHRCFDRFPLGYDDHDPFLDFIPSDPILDDL
jgi:hypothetical protein